MTRVGIDARLTRQMSVGMKTYVRELSARLPRVAPEYEYVTFERGANFGFEEQVLLPLAMRRARIALVHFASLYVPVLSPVPSVVTIHDLIHLRFPEYFKAKVRPYYETVVRLACSRARRVITDDERTIDDLVRYLDVDPGKVRVVPLGVQERFFRGGEPARVPRPYFLYVGNHREHKSLPTLFDAWSSLPESLAVDLYVTGPDDFDGELDRRRRSNRAIVALGDIDVEALIAYYAGALALVTPALTEGFGLPVLEAMAAGCPVVASAEAIPVRLAPYAQIFPPKDAAFLGNLLTGIAGNQVEREATVKEARNAARSLTWDACARATADVYREALEQR